MPDYFIREGSRYLFRRRVPERLQPRIGLKEIYRSLKTSVRSEARKRAAALYLVSERLFDLAEYELLSDEEIRACARRWLGMPGWRKIIAANIDNMTPAELRYDADDVPGRLLTGWQDEGWTPQQERQEQAYSALLSAGYQGPFGEETINRTLDELLSLLSQRVEKRRQEVFRPEETQVNVISPVAPQAVTPTAPTGTPRVLEYVDQWQKAVVKGWNDAPGIDPHSAGQYRVAVRLFTEIIGDKPVGTVTFEDAAHFRAQLLRLPSTLGKGRYVHALKAIERADASGAQRMGMKTVKRHVTALNRYWAWLRYEKHLPHEISPFSGHAFPGTKSKKSNRDDWSAEALERLFKCADYQQATKHSADHWLPLIALHSGMRIEEICRLRPSEDIRLENGIHCFVLQPHPDGWDPKTEAGERKVPIHSWLLKHGFMELVELRRKDGSARVFPELPMSSQNKLSAQYSREFSRLKIGIGIPKKVVFHSFRHTFRTILASTDFKESHIDAVVGHEGVRGEGSTYVKRVAVKKLKEVVEGFESPLPLDFLKSHSDPSGPIPSPRPLRSRRRRTEART